MKIVFFGTPEFAVPTLRGLLEAENIEVVGVVTQPDKRRGRGNQLNPSPVKEVALEYPLPLWQPSRLKRDTETLAALQATHADAFVVVAYGQLLSPAVLAMPKLGCINVHGSLLPQYRGAAPMQWGLYQGDRLTGITTMLMDQGMDTGPMLLRQEVEIGLFDSLAEVSQRLSHLGADLLLQTLEQLQAGQLQPIPQEESQATYAPLLKKTDFWLDWQRPAIALHHQVRGFYANCMTEFQGQILKVFKTVPLDFDSQQLFPDSLQPLIPLCSNLPTQGEPGEIVALWKNWGPVIQTGQGFLLLHQVQPPGKRPQSGWDWVNGSRLSLGMKLLTRPAE